MIEIPMCLGISLLFVLLCNLGHDVTRFDAGILIVLFLLFIGYTIFMAKKGEDFDREDDDEVVVDKHYRTGGHVLEQVVLQLDVVIGSRVACCTVIGISAITSNAYGVVVEGDVVVVTINLDARTAVAG